jgi:putative SOS response-associated peptidase YedK
MCNRYRPSSVVRIRDAFGFTYIESGPDLRLKPAIGPLQYSPFVRAGGEVRVGQWGLTPDKSKTLKPQRADGKPMSTNNARWGQGKPEKWSFLGPWLRQQRCIVVADDFDEPYWGTGKNVWWRFARADGAPWAIAGLWNEWTDPGTGEVTFSHTMLTVNCDQHPILRHMHKPDPKLPDDQQDKRTVAVLERDQLDVWLHGSAEQAAAVISVPRVDVFAHGPADPSVDVRLPV